MGKDLKPKVRTAIENKPMLGLYSAFQIRDTTAKQRVKGRKNAVLKKFFSVNIPSMTTARTKEIIIVVGMVNNA